MTSFEDQQNVAKILYLVLTIRVSGKLTHIRVISVFAFKKRTLYLLHTRLGKSQNVLLTILFVFAACYVHGKSDTARKL